MDQKPFDCKHFDSGATFQARGVTPAPLLERLLSRTQILLDEGMEDLREMCKKHETTNLMGLAAHRIERPLPANWDPAAHLKARFDATEIDYGQYGRLIDKIRVQPMICVRGRLAGGSALALPVEVYAPLGAPIAMAAKAMLWPAAEGAEFEPRLKVLVWNECLPHLREPGAEDRLIAYWPDAGLALLVGYDDPSLLADVLWDKAQRAWEDEAKAGRIVEEEGRLEVTGEGSASFKRDEEPTTAQWVASLDTMLEENAGGARVMTPVWANPILPADCLAAGPEWRDAALAVDSLPFGVNIDVDGRFPPFEGSSELQGWIVVPRPSLPAPMPRACRSYRICS
ncbi:MAG: hypothetical protein ABFD69_02115 [Candidatus Sumerlaeia bacterium]